MLQIMKMVFEMTIAFSQQNNYTINVPDCQWILESSCIQADFIYDIYGASFSLQ